MVSYRHGHREFRRDAPRDHTLPLALRDGRSPGLSPRGSESYTVREGVPPTACPPGRNPGMTLDPQTIVAITDELAAAERDRTTVPLLSTRYPDMTVEDAYAVQDEWRERGTAAGRRLVGRKIGLTSRVMQEASGITEPDYGAIFADAVVENGSVVDFDRFSNVRVEVELAFRLSAPLQRAGRHPPRRAGRDGVRRAGAGDPVHADRAGGPHDRRHDQ